MGTTFIIAAIEPVARAEVPGRARPKRSRMLLSISRAELTGGVAVADLQAG
jgi:hypothetical protein